MSDQEARGRPAPGQDADGQAFGDLLRQLRLAAGLTQEELADHSGLSVRAVADMERGRAARSGLVTGAAAGRSGLAALAGAVAGPSGLLRPAAATPAAPVPRQLPVAVRDFAGRAAERADYAVIGDLNQVIPALVDAIRARSRQS